MHLGIDPDQSRWIPVPGRAEAWRHQESATHGSSGDRGEECPAFVFRNDFEPGVLSQEGGSGTLIIYVTSGGYRIRVDRHTIIVADPTGRNRIEHWGDPHENLNGKHIKDWAGAPGWDGSQRSILLHDGSKITMTATGAQGLVGQTSIYDGRTHVQIDNITNTIVHHGTDPVDTQTRDDAQHDGETALFESSAVTGVATYSNIYNEDATFDRIEFDRPLGASGGCANPNQVNDYFDDPRLGHT